ncbi:hypothetical protein ILYODFUR_007072 [Ilyodon furcidens]|uniref:Uncharacterized protein n=1 Tax=Ilyodon furcidens TaxID=33524 RepID=A0ABV0VBU3_9TELE
MRNSEFNSFRSTQPLNEKLGAEVSQTQGRHGKSDSLSLPPHLGARALTPTQPSVTSASRVRLFPRYVRRIFLPSAVCFNTETEQSRAEPGEINKKPRKSVAVRTGLTPGVTFVCSRWTERSYTYKLLSVKSVSGCCVSPFQCKLFLTLHCAH